MAGLRVIAHMGNIPARIFCIIRGGNFAMPVKGAKTNKLYCRRLFACNPAGMVILASLLVAVSLR